MIFRWKTQTRTGPWDIPGHRSLDGILIRNGARALALVIRHRTMFKSCIDSKRLGLVLVRTTTGISETLARVINLRTRRRVDAIIGTLEPAVTVHEAQEKDERKTDGRYHRVEISGNG